MSTLAVATQFTDTLERALIDREINTLGPGLFDTAAEHLLRWVLGTLVMLIVGAMLATRFFH